MSGIPSKRAGLRSAHATVRRENPEALMWRGVARRAAGAALHRRVGAPRERLRGFRCARNDRRRRVKQAIRSMERNEEKRQPASAMLACRVQSVLHHSGSTARTDRFPQKNWTPTTCPRPNNFWPGRMRTTTVCEGSRSLHASNILVTGSSETGTGSTDRKWYGNRTCPFAFRLILTFISSLSSTHWL
jgi:hypothetical protein